MGKGAAVDLAEKAIKFLDVLEKGNRREGKETPLSVFVINETRDGVVDKRLQSGSKLGLTRTLFSRLSSAFPSAKKKSLINYYFLFIINNTVKPSPSTRFISRILAFVPEKEKSNFSKWLVGILVVVAYPLFTDPYDVWIPLIRGLFTFVKVSTVNYNEILLLPLIFGVIF